MVITEQIAAWEEPPEVDGRLNYAQSRYAEVAEALQENQGKWAMLIPRDSVQQAKSLAANIRNGKIASFSPAGAFEVVRKDENVWVRYIGEKPGMPVRKPREYAKPDAMTARAVRTWAKATGRPVSERGRIKTSLINEWRAATRGQA